MKDSMPEERPTTHFAALCWLLALSSLGLLHTVNAAPFPEERQIAGFTLEKSGEAKVRFLFMDVMQGALFRCQTAPDEAINLFDHALELSLYYNRRIPADKIRDGGVDILKRNVDEETFNALEARIDLINEAYVDVQEGDTYTLRYLPEGQTKLFFNGEEVASIPGRDFAQAYFQIWLGEKPLSKSFRDGLMAAGSDS